MEKEPEGIARARTRTRTVRCTGGSNPFHFQSFFFQEELDEGARTAG